MRILLVPAERIDPVDLLSPNTLCRCEAALKAWRSGQYDKLLLTGGYFLPKERQTKPAAESMKTWFLLKGVAPKAILTETTSLDTYQNVAFALDVLRKEGFTGSEITVLTQYQHAIRFLATFFLAHGVRVRTIPIRQPQMRWVDWVVEWAVLIPCHLLDWKGTLFLARLNRQMRQRAAGIT